MGKYTAEAMRLNQLTDVNESCVPEKVLLTPKQKQFQFPFFGLTCNADVMLF